MCMVLKRCESTDSWSSGESKGKCSQYYLRIKACHSWADGSWFLPSGFAFCEANQQNYDWVVTLKVISFVCQPNYWQFHIVGWKGLKAPKIKTLTHFIWSLLKSNISFGRKCSCLPYSFPSTWSVLSWSTSESLNSAQFLIPANFSMMTFSLLYDMVATKHMWLIKIK